MLSIHFVDRYSPGLVTAVDALRLRALARCRISRSGVDGAEWSDDRAAVAQADDVLAGHFICTVAAGTTVVRVEHPSLHCDQFR